MNWPLLSLRIQLALAKFRRFSNDGMTDRANWDRRVGDLEYELASLDCPLGSSFGRTANALPSSFIQGLPQCAEVKSGDLHDGSHFSPDSIANARKDSTRGFVCN